MKLISSYLFLIAMLGIFSSCDNGNEKKSSSNVTLDTSRLNINTNNVNPYAIVDVSPMDISYFPADHPKLKMENPALGSPLARVIYSRPHLQGRQLFHDLLKYDEPWRLGANESTELDLYKPATIQNKTIATGRYVLYCIPQKENWIIILNSNIDSWGLHPDSTKDLHRFTIPVKHTSNHLEYFTIVWENAGKSAELVMAWDDIEARLPVIFPAK